MYHDRKSKKNKLDCKFEFRVNCKQRLTFHQGTIDDYKFMSVDASQFCLCRNPTNSLLSMTKSAHRCMFCNESVKHDKSAGLTHSRVKTDIELIIFVVSLCLRTYQKRRSKYAIRQKESAKLRRRFL